MELIVFTVCLVVLCVYVACIHKWQETLRKSLREKIQEDIGDDN